MKRPPQLSDNPRRVAFQALEAVFNEKRPPEEALASGGLLLAPRDLALASALTYEVLRHKTFLDWQARNRLRQGRAPKELLTVLRLGLAQLFYFDRLGNHAVVMETVALAKEAAPGRQGVVNAVLRGLLREREAGAPWPPALPDSGDPVRDLALKFSHPEWLVRRWMREGVEVPALLAANNRATPPTLRVNAGKIRRENFVPPFESELTAFSPWGLRLKNFSGRPEEWPGYAEGLFAVQDEASQLVGLLGKASGRILDACAGLGGKTLALAMAKPEADLIVALDRDSAKLSRLEAEARRLGLAGRIETRPADLLTEALPENEYDLAVLDAPCSGLGVIRRRPDLKWSKAESDLPRLARNQLALLQKTAKSVRVGGQLLYGVCSPSDEEGPGVLDAFLDSRPDFQPVEAARWPEILRPLLAAGPCLRLWPHQHGTDGFFWAWLERRP